MKFQKFDDKYVVRIDKNEEVIREIKKLCLQENIKAASVSAIGAVKSVALGFFEPVAKKYKELTLHKPFELTSLVGNITTKDGELYTHFHANIADTDLRAYGGHLTHAQVTTTVEAIIIPINGEIERTFNDEVGLNILFKED